MTIIAEAGPSSTSLPSISPRGPSRPPFQPIFHPANNPCPLSTPNETWIELISAECPFTLQVFLSTLKDLCLHPERNSSLILRADPLPPREVTDDVDIPGLERMETLRVRLMPKQPKRDGKLDQRCIFYRNEDTRHDVRKEEGVLLMIPEVKEVGDVPFYHPPVRKLAFRYESNPPLTGELAMPENRITNNEPPVKGQISIAYLPFDTLPSPTPVQHLTIPLPPGQSDRAPRRRSPLAGPPMGQGENTAGSTPPPAVILASDGSIPDEEDTKRDNAIIEERLHRTCLGLLERVYKHGHGNMVGYEKRVNHDVGYVPSRNQLRHLAKSTSRCQIIVPREAFQDLYLALKDRHRHLDSRAPKAGSTKIEDLKRHVFKVSAPLPLSFHPSLSLHPSLFSFPYLFFFPFLSSPSPSSSLPSSAST